MKSFKTAIIAGALALVAVIATVIVLTSGSSGYGLYISSVSGDVVISNAEGTTQAAAETFLATGDALTVNTKILEISSAVSKSISRLAAMIPPKIDTGSQA